MGSGCQAINLSFNIETLEKSGVCLLIKGLQFVNIRTLNIVMSCIILQYVHICEDLLAKKENLTHLS